MSRIPRRLGRVLLGAVLLAPALPARGESALLVDGFDYAETATARAARQAIEGSPLVEMADSGA